MAQSIPYSTFLRALEGPVDFVAISIPRLYYPPELTREAVQISKATQLQKLLNNTSVINVEQNSTEITRIFQSLSSSEMEELVKVSLESTENAIEGCLRPYLRLLGYVSGVQDGGGRTFGVRYASAVGAELTRLYNLETLIQIATDYNLPPPETDPGDAEDQYMTQVSRMRVLTQILAHLYRGTVDKVRMAPSVLYHFYSSQISSCVEIRERAEALGDPYSGECQDEDLWTVYETVKNIYEDSLVETVNSIGTLLSTDQRSGNGKSLSQIPDLFRTDVLPHITRGYLRNKCQRGGNDKSGCSKSAKCQQ